MDSLLTLILVLVTFWVLCPTTTQATEQDAEILEDILTRYRENIRKEKNYIPGLTQPVLFEPRPQIRPTAGHYTLLLVIPRETVQNRYKELKKHMLKPRRENHQISGKSRPEEAGREEGSGKPSPGIFLSVF